MRDALQDFTDRVPRWGEMSPRQRVGVLVAVGVIIALVLLSALWAAGAFRSSEPSTPAAKPATGPAYEAGFVDCHVAPDTTSPGSDVLLLVTDDRGLPYHATPATTQMFTSAGRNVLRVNVCMPSKATPDQLKDVATMIAQNVKSSYPQQTNIDLIAVTNIGSGDAMTGQVTTRLHDHAFSKDDGVYAQRSVWNFAAS